VPGDEEFTRKPVSRMRRAIAKSMSASAQVPQITLEFDVDCRAMVSYRDGLRAAGVNASYSDLLTAACAQELVAHPEVNSSFQGDEIFEWDNVNVGLAVALPDGLIAPAIMNADRLTLAQLADERRRLTEAALGEKLTSKEAFSATFTISNLGQFGVRRFQALVVPPQAGILAVGAITAASEMSLCLSLDHRVVDGAPGAAFLADVAGRLQSLGWADELL
jgi:pyruvate/2-oxoglutarate dehydrogenase complex dihydrolipoamide acyltransferase (E2) component